MDPDLIYAKTSSGEEAMQKRTRVMQRNVRMVLILVDGQSTVADLCLKTGNKLLTENALRDLEKGGFVQPKIEQDSLWAESKKVAQEIRDSAVSKARQISGNTHPEETNPSTPEPVIPESRVFVHSVFPPPARDVVASQISQFSIAHSQFKLSTASFLPQEPESTVVEMKAAPVPLQNEGKSTLSGRLKRLFRSADLTPDIKPVRRVSRNPIGWPMLSFAGVVVFFVLLFTALLLFPYEHYLGDVETTISRSIGMPVKVGSMRVNLYPDPGLVLGEVRVGAGKELIPIAEMRLQPVLGSILSSRKIFSEVVVSGMILPLGGMTILSRISDSVSVPSSPATFRNLRFEKTDIVFAGLGLGGMAGEYRRKADGSAGELLFQTTDRSLSINSRALGNRVEIVAEGFGWKPSQNSLFHFDSVNIKATVENAMLTVTSMDLRLFDGFIRGVAILQDGPVPVLSGDIRFERINATRLGDSLGFGQQFSGETGGSLRFSSRPPSWVDVMSAMNAEGDFTVRRGSIRGIDLAEAVRRVSSAPMQGGNTLFEQLSGKVRLAPAGAQLSGLVMNSGLMQSSGSLDIASDRTVNGRMELRMLGTANQTRISLSIKGPLKAPFVQAGSAR